MWHALGRLAAEGQAIDFAALWRDLEAPTDPASVEKPKLALSINGSNYGKLYPPPGGAAALPAPNPEPIANSIASPAARPPIESRPETSSPNGNSPAAPQQDLVTMKKDDIPAPPAIEPPAPTAPPAPAPTASPEVHSEWVRAYQEAQQQTVDAHAAFQRSMAETQASFLETMQASFAGLNTLLAGESPVTGDAAPASRPQPAAPRARGGVAALQAAVPAPARPPAPAVEEAVAEPIAEPAEPAPALQVEAPAPIEPPAPAVEEAASAEPTPIEEPATSVATSVSAPDQSELQSLMLDVVADKTGYPVEMLTLEMDMEADLGIDSIKRVEILSAMREREPRLPEVDTAKMAQLQTLGQIVDYMKSTASEAAPQESIPAPAASPAAATPDQGAMQALMLDVVADKTGYPQEMLTLEMDMEADLGIDSIKRVEILSAMREKEPALPEVDTAKMAQLQTLGQIVDYMKDAAPAVAAPAATPAAPVASAEAPSSLPAADELQALMLDVVAEKTGYPQEMLTLEMDMEADLGIDSIKRVEILSAMREKEPGLPEVDTAKMAQLQTLGQIVDYMKDAAGVADSAPAPVQEPAAAPSTASPNTASLSTADLPAPGELQQLMLEVVADKTGYPVEMLDLAMDMEADLGIDSIKRVEILSAMREKEPGLPEVDTAKMAQLQTLGQIVDYMKGQGAEAEEKPAFETSELPITAPAAAEELDTSSDTAIGRFALREIDAPAAGLAMAGLATANHVAITVDGSGIAAALAEKLIQRGVNARVVQEVPADAPAVIFLGGLIPVADLAEGREVNREASALHARWRQPSPLIRAVSS